MIYCSWFRERRDNSVNSALLLFPFLFVSLCVTSCVRLYVCPFVSLFFYSSLLFLVCPTIYLTLFFRLLSSLHLFLCEAPGYCGRPVDLVAGVGGMRSKSEGQPALTAVFLC